MLNPLDLPARRLLVIAPHPDDETLGCGGLIASFAAAGRTTHTMFVTDGGASHPNSIAWPRERLAAQRRDEATEALDRLGAGGHERRFLDLLDAAMPARGSPAWRAACETLANIVHAFAPDLALLPWRRDPHCDHRASWQLTMDALEAANASPAMLGYAVWLDELGRAGDWPAAGEAEEVRFDISAVLDAKREAVAAHVSQTTDLVGDDPDGFRLTQATIDRLTGPGEAYWRKLR